jgi:MoaD family protein
LELKVKLLKPFSDIVGKKELRVEMEGETLDDLFRTMIKEFPKLEDQLFTEENELADHVNIFVNDRPISDNEEMSKGLSNGDEILLFIPISGG